MCVAGRLLNDTALLRSSESLQNGEGVSYQGWMSQTIPFVGNKMRGGPFSFFSTT